jgi:hypothetical protein
MGERLQFQVQLRKLSLLVGDGLNKGYSDPVGDQNLPEHPQAIPSQLE